MKLLNSPIITMCALLAFGLIAYSSWGYNPECCTPEQNAALSELVREASHVKMTKVERAKAIIYLFAEDK